MFNLYSGDNLVCQFDANFNITAIQNEALCPLYLQRTKDVRSWLESRAIDSHRQNSRLLKRVLRMEEKDDVSTVLMYNAATITDNYWVNDERNFKAYADVRFKSDEFSRVALLGDSKGFNLKPSPTPELTNIGSYEKCWIYKEDAWALVKRASLVGAYSEIFIAKLGTHLGFDMASYHRYDKGSVITEDFTQNNRYNFHSALSLMSESYEQDFERNYEIFLRINPNIAKKYSEMIFLDGLCMNYDRHINNYGVLTDIHTGNILDFAPNFDNNLALLVNDISAGPIAGFTCDYKEFFENHPAPDIPLDVLEDAIDYALETTSAEFSVTELTQLPCAGDIKRFISNSFKSISPNNRSSVQEYCSLYDRDIDIPDDLSR